jgi:hypothetical protein
MLPSGSDLTIDLKNFLHKSGKIPMKFLPIVVSILVLLGGCARGGAHGPTTDSATRSGVEFYGVLDVGVGTQDVSR